MNTNAKRVAFSALIAAIYASLTVAISPLSYGITQVRFSEALTVLPALTPYAITGVFMGCLIANIFTGSIVDIVFGSLTTLVAACCTYALRKKPFLMPLPPVVLNGLVVGFYLWKLYGGVPLWMSMLSVAGGQFISCYIIGLPLYFGIQKIKSKIL